MSQTKKFYQIEELANKDGLDIIKDKYGFIWVAHNSGVIRYDGYDIVEYNIKVENPNRIKLESVWKMYLDSKQQLWIGGGNRGCARYDYEREYFHHYDTGYFQNAKIPLQQVKSFSEENGKIWIGSAHGLFYYNYEEDKFFNVPNIDSDGEPIDVIHSTLIDNTGILWFGTATKNLYKYDIKKNIIQRYKEGSFKQKSNRRQRILCLYQDSKDEIWACGDYLLLNINPYTNEQVSLLHLLKEPDEIIYIIENEHGNFWITAGGINIYNPELKTMEYYSSDEKNQNSISSNVTSRIYIDNQGIYWIGGWYGSGVDVYYGHKKPFTHYEKTPGTKSSLSNNIVHCFYQYDSTTIYMGTEDGVLNKFDTENETFTQYKDPLMPTNEAITGISKGKNKNELILGTWGSLKIFNIKSGRFVRMQNNPNNSESLIGNRIPSMFQGDSNNVWIGVEWGGLDEMNVHNRTFKHHSELVTGKCAQNMPFVRHISKDSYGNIWIVGWASLYRYDRSIPCFYKVNQDNHIPYALDEGQVYFCFQDSKNRLWVGNTKGINLYNYKEEYFMDFGPKQGMDGSEVKAILEDSEGNLWLATDAGISKFRLPAFANSITKDSAYLQSISDDFTYFVNYNNLDGVQDGQFLHGTLNSDNGTMYFGGTEGFNAFKPEEMILDTFVAPIQFIEFRLFNKLVKPKSELNPDSPLKKSISLTKHITLTHKQYIFSLKWASLNYYATQKIEYAYIMEGFEKEWSYVGKTRSAFYTGMPPGDYTFRVKAANSDGIWNQDEATIKITVLPPWYKTWWFKMLAVIWVVGVTFLYTYVRLKGLKRQKEILQERVNANTKRLQEINLTKDKFFSIIAHDLRTPFHSLLGYSDLLLHHSENFDQSELYNMYNQINEVSTQTLGLLENLLEWSLNQANKIEYKVRCFDSITYIDKSISLLKSAAASKGIDLLRLENKEMFIKADVNTANTVLRNLISNAIKFTPRKGIVTVNAKQVVRNNISFIEFCVADTGIGMSSEKVDSLFQLKTSKSRRGTEKESGTGLGLILCKDFVTNNGGEIWLESELGKGSRFYFTLPEAVSLQPGS